MEDRIKAIYQMRFPQKLWYLINQYTDEIIWGHTRKTILLNYIILHNYLRSADSIFKTSNVSSFVRQLNLYGFRKVTSHLQDPLCNSNNPFMHEYSHEFFQFDRPELLNRIIRKHLALKRNINDESVDHVICYPKQSNPLQKARRAFRLALRIAAQNLYQDQPSYNSDPQDSGEENEFIDISMLKIPSINPINNAPIQDPLPSPALNAEPTEDANKQVKNDESFKLKIIKIEPLNKSVENSQEMRSMPELETDSKTLGDGVELLAQFSVNDLEEIEQKKKSFKQDKNKLNHVVPSVKSENNEDNGGHFSPEEWEKIFNDIENRVSTQEETLICNGQEKSILKNVYSQISETYDLLNV